jgi:Leucine-rich repeat (LRR) protein
MLTVLSLRKARESESIWQAIMSCTALHITDRIDELTPDDFFGLDHIVQLVVGPQIEEIHAENTGFRPSGRDTKSCLIPNSLFRELRSLRQLEIRMKGITELHKNSFAGLPYLECLILSGNRISFIHKKAFTGLGNLKTLHLDHNRMSEINRHYFSSLSFLNVLRLESNRIEQIAPKAFAGNPFLVTLSLQHNKLSRLDPASFEGLKNLSTLDLSANTLAHGDLKFIRHLGRSTEIAIQTKKGSLTFSKTALSRVF